VFWTQHRCTGEGSVSAMHVSGGGGREFLRKAPTSPGNWVQAAIFGKSHTLRYNIRRNPSNQMRFLGDKLAKTVHAAGGCAPESRPRLEKLLTALLIPHSWIRGRVCVIISKEIEIRKGKRVKEGIVDQKFIFTYPPAANIFHQHPCRGCHRPFLASNF